MADNFNSLLYAPNIPNYDIGTPLVQGLQTGVQLAQAQQQLENQQQQLQIQAKEADRPKRYKNIYAFLGPEKKLIPIGLIAAMFQGAVMPVFGFLLGSVLEHMVTLSTYSNK